MYSTMLRQLPRASRSLHAELHLPLSPPTCMVLAPHRDVHTGISDPQGPNQDDLSTLPVSLQPHPRDPSSRPPDGAGPSDGGFIDNTSQEASTSPSTSSNLPALHETSAPTYRAAIRPYTHPPFHTHRFFKVLEETFPTAIAQGLMRAMRALLVDRTGRVRRDGLTIKDLEKQAYLFKAALSELRAEISVRHGNETGAIRGSTAALRREIDVLDQKMKEDVGNLKHEIQMELDNRKTEYKTELKRQDILIEELLNKSIVTLGDLRTSMEEVKWVVMLRTVVGLAGCLVLIVITLELRPKTPPPRPPAEAIRHPEAEGLERTDFIT